MFAGWILLASGALLLAGWFGWLRWTNVDAQRRATVERQNLLTTWSTIPLDEPVPLQAGESFALLYIPRLRDNVWGLPILHGVSDAELRAGVGHYPSSSRPGEVGNFALAGHRTAHGEPFSAFDALQDGDEVIVRTPKAHYVYTLVRDQIVNPRDVWVITPQVATSMLDTPSASIITLITCTPKWSTRQRWVWWGVLTRTVDTATMRP